MLGVCVCVCYGPVWRLGNNSGDLVVTFHHVVPGITYRLAGLATSVCCLRPLVAEAGFELVSLTYSTGLLR